MKIVVDSAFVNLLRQRHSAQLQKSMNEVKQCYEDVMGVVAEGDFNEAILKRTMPKCIVHSSSEERRQGDCYRSNERAHIWWHWRRF